VVGFFLLDRALAAVEVGHERQITRLREAVGHAANLVVQAPPFLDHDDGGRAFGLLRAGEITLKRLAVRAGKGNHGSGGLCHGGDPWWFG
jgi:hypothetical protein